jgi:hypothetical protein
MAENCTEHNTEQAFRITGKFNTTPIKAFSNVTWQNNSVPKSPYVMNTYAALLTHFLPKQKKKFTMQQTFHPFNTFFTSES